MAAASSQTSAMVSGSMFLARFVRTLVRLGRATGLVSTSSDSTAPAMTLWSNWNALECARGLAASSAFHHCRTSALVSSSTGVVPSAGTMWLASNESQFRRVAGRRSRSRSHVFASFSTVGGSGLGAAAAAAACANRSAGGRHDSLSTSRRSSLSQVSASAAMVKVTGATCRCKSGPA